MLTILKARQLTRLRLNSPVWSHFKTITTKRSDEHFVNAKDTNERVSHLSTRNESNKSITSENNQEFRLIYEGPLSRKLKILKMLSLSTTVLSLTCGPLLVFYGKQSIPFVGKIVMAGTVVTMGVTTTIVMHWLTKVYVHKMYFHPHSRTFHAETSTIFGTLKKHKFSVSDIVIPEIDSPFSTFEVKGRKYFLHQDLKEAEQILKYVRDYNCEEL